MADFVLLHEDSSREPGKEVIVNLDCICYYEANGEKGVTLHLSDGLTLNVTDNINHFSSLVRNIRH